MNDPQVHPDDQLEVQLDQLIYGVAYLKGDGSGWLRRIDPVTISVQTFETIAVDEAEGIA